MDKFLCFCVGAAIGSVVTWRIIKNKYERISKEEIESVKEVFSKKSEARANEIVKEYLDKSIKAKKTAEKIADDFGYVTIKEDDDDTEGDFYEIDVNDFGEFEDYGQVSFKMFNDGVMIDSDGNIAEDVDDLLAEIDSRLESDSTGDIICFRDDMRCCDYEIILVPNQSYEEHLASK